MVILISLGFIKKEHGNVKVNTYIDGKLAAVPIESTKGYKVANINCTNGTTAKFNYSTWRLEIAAASNDSTCTIEFVSNDEKNFADYLIEKVCTTTPTENHEAVDCLVNENGYRYEGSNPNNYVLFNNELWRIIGVFNVATENGSNQNLVKLIRNSEIDSLSWNNSYSGNWGTSSLQEQLNNGYLNATDSTCAYYANLTKTCYFSKTGLDEISRNQIESVDWHLSVVGDTDSPVTTIYSDERSGSDKWTGKVGLMYPSDYGYAVLASSCSRTTNVSRYYTSDCSGENWLNTHNYEWSIAKYYNGLPMVLGYVISGTDDPSSYNVRPTIYLKSEIKLMGGNGSYDNPYEIS